MSTATLYVGTVLVVPSTFVPRVTFAVDPAEKPYAVTSTELPVGPAVGVTVT